LPPFAASVEIADVVLAGDGDSAISAVLVVAGGSVAGRRHVTGVFVVRRIAGRNGDSNGQESSDDKL
jgi:hypothetical protein